MMQQGLFTATSKYTIDICSLLELFREGRSYPKQTFTSLFTDLNRSIENNLIVSHIEVYKEIEYGEDKHDELLKWASARKYAFKNYALPSEQKVISSLSPKYSSWVNEKISPNNADPWLIAQAKCDKLTIITQENLTQGSTPTKKIHIPDVCKDYGIRCINLLQLIQEQGWSY